MGIRTELIHVYATRPTRICMQSANELTMVATVAPLVAERSSGRGPETNRNPLCINHLKTVRLGDTEMLVAARDNGIVNLYYFADQSPFLRYAFTRDMPRSAWGIASLPDRNVLAVSCNARCIKL